MPSLNTQTGLLQSKMTVHKKLGMILENKGLQKLKEIKQQQKNTTNFNQNCTPKLLFLIEKYQKYWDIQYYVSTFFD